MTQLAIKGHATRGKEVIEMLEMLGGRIMYTYNGDDDVAIYFIDGLYIMGYKLEDVKSIGFTVFTLEEFLEKFPYKIGDKVQDLKSGEVFTISNMFWDEKDCTVYYFNPDIIQYYNVENLKLYKEINEMSNNITLTHSDKEVEKKSLLASLKEYFKTTPKEVLEREWNEHKELDEIGPTVEEYIDFVERFKKQSKYPRTYKECCKVLCCEPVIGFDGLNYDEENLYKNFIILKRCRDAYWKIAGEQMGLEKPWEPEWQNTVKYCIESVYGSINYRAFNDIQYCILVFPTEEMRDIFYENFKDLIEACKELL